MAHLRCQRGQQFRRHRTGYIEGFFQRAPVGYLSKERIACDIGSGIEICHRHRARIQKHGVRPIRKQIEGHGITILGRGHLHQFQKTPQTDHNLAAERISMRQQTVRIDKKCHPVRGRDIRYPRLPVMRVGCKNGIAERAQARVVIATCLRPRGYSTIGAARDRKGAATCSSKH